MTNNLFTGKVFMVFIVACCLVGTMVMVATNQAGIRLLSAADAPGTKSTPDESSNHYIQQRNDLSRTLNDQKKMFGQQSCEMIKLKAKTGKQVEARVSENGGWCQEMSGSSSAAHRFDEGFAKSLSTFLSGKHVGSFGDGPGDYKKAMDSYKQVASYTAYDGAPYCESTTDGRVKFLDLSGPQFGLPAYDWVISVEVGEHIPAKFEDIYLDNLARHAKEGIILSWAVPGQGGLSHVNNHPLEHVIKQMNKRGFDINKEAGEPLRKASSFYWLKANIHVYKRINSETFKPDDA